MPDDRLREQLVATFCLAILVGIAFFSAYAGMSPVQQAQNGPFSGAVAHTGQETAQKNGTEFWPPFLGYRLKVTDTLVVAFTGGLFLSTYALWQATRRLVIGAENTSERQLRAYVFTEGVSLWTTEKSDGVWIILSVKFKNFGQTPAYSFGSWSDTKISVKSSDLVVKQSRKRNTIIATVALLRFGLMKGHFCELISMPYSPEINSFLPALELITLTPLISNVRLHSTFETATEFPEIVTNGKLRTPGVPMNIRSAIRTRHMWLVGTGHPVS